MLRAQTADDNVPEFSRVRTRSKRKLPSCARTLNVSCMSRLPNTLVVSHVHTDV